MDGLTKRVKCALCVKRTCMTEIQMLCGRQWCVINLERNQRCSTTAAWKRPEQKDRSGAILREWEELFCCRGKQSLAADPCECALRGTVPNLLAAPSTVEPQKKKKRMPNLSRANEVSDIFFFMAVGCHLQAFSLGRLFNVSCWRVLQ